MKLLRTVAISLPMLFMLIAGAIVTDGLSDTAINSAGIMKNKGFTSAVVVTQYFHITRSQYALKQAGVTQVSTAHARYFEWRDLYSIAREVVALPAYWWTARS
ncbi:hypothetical protein [Pseudomonas sp. CDFA 610]|uniref:hypothetical protein n=1 Tax=Pseudomonas sp. CDFA 610 TaxID=2829825 RepID=UPI001E298F1D|nr:hypothetical protein [Pseudomonas sp. CDFA 610]MCD5985153.1 hypothetical protein [Pseudomonas sp. CDFA 610]